MIGVLADMGLEQNRFAHPGHPSAIDEVSGDMTYLGHVRVRRDMIAVRQDETRKSVRMLFENGAEIRELHVRSIYLLRNMVK